eukprot:jgi/Chrzof1/10344/Cz04g38180.t1
MAKNVRSVGILALLCAVFVVSTIILVDAQDLSLNGCNPDQGSGSGISAATLVQGPGNRPLTRVTGRKSECLPGTGLPGRSSSSSSSSSSSTTRGPGGVPTTDADNDTDGTQVAGAQAAGPQAAATQPQFAAAAVAPPTNAQIEQQVFDQVNTFRVQNGLGALIRWPGADNQARQHSSNMAAGTVGFGHTGFQQRVQGSGLAWRSAGENVAYNYGYADPATQAVNGWKNSAGHRANMLKAAFTHTGVGVARASNGAVYFTQLFIQKA